MEECVNCGEPREIVTEGLCFSCYRKVNAVEPEAPGDMGDEELGEAVARIAEEVASSCERLRPYLAEIRKRFWMKEKRSDTIFGCRAWNEFCEKVLGRTRRAANYILNGGNKKRTKREVGNMFPTSRQNGDQGNGDTLPTGDDFLCSACGAAWNDDSSKCPKCGQEDSVALKRMARKVAANLLKWMQEPPVDRATLREAAPGMDQETVADIQLGLQDQDAYQAVVAVEVLQRRLPVAAATAGGI
jgi:rubrerythrin